jgi:hypothetical protein
MKSFSVLALSAVLTVPCFANAIVSNSSLNLPFPTSRGKVAMSSPGLPAPRQLGKAFSFAMGSPGLPAPRQLGKAFSFAMSSPGLPAPRQLGKAFSFAMSSPGLPAPRQLGKS